MTNNWADMGNSTCVIVMGANPAENHPASIAHINRARTEPPKILPHGGTSDKVAAKLIVIDPRKTRTALQADLYVRIRPGTDIAFINGLIREIIARMQASGGSVPAATKANFFSFLNESSAQPFYVDGDATNGSVTSSIPGGSKYTDARFLIASGGQDYDRGTYSTVTGNFTPDGTENAGQLISNFPKKAASCTAEGTVFSNLKAHVAPYTLAEVADICGCSEAEISAVATAYIEHARCSSYDSGAPSTIVHDPTSGFYRATTMLYAMGLTQHTHGSQNVNAFAALQSLLGNMGRAGGGINALRGIHNVQGSTDMGVLYHLIPAYSGNPAMAQQPTVEPLGFGRYMDPLWGLPVNGSANRTVMNMSYDDAYLNAAMGLQQRGFYNMTLRFFGDYDYVDGLGGVSAGGAKRTAVDAAFSLWPKGNGHHHIKMFREMAESRTKAAVVWGQNPCVTEPNQGSVREGFKNLDLLVCVDLFENETAACDRKEGAVTILIPSCSHVEKAGSSANSGRVLQWRYQAVAPLGNSKDDLELLLRFAKAFQDAGAFGHIEIGTNGIAAGQAYDKLYGSQYGYTPGVDTYATVSGTAEMAILGESISDPSTYLWPNPLDPAGPLVPYTTVYGSEWVNELIYRQMCQPHTTGGTIWIYVRGFSTARAGDTHTQKAGSTNGVQPNWATDNRAKARDRWDGNNTLAFPGWGYSWLVNRRVLYGNGEVPGDIGDFFMGPDSCARIFTSDTTLSGRGLNYSRWYRFYHRLADKPRLSSGAEPAVHVIPGRFNAHTEPYETPRPDVAAKYGFNTNAANAHGGVGGATGLNLTMAHTQVGTVANYPLVLTTIRCVEHFQGGPITRNNAWNVEIEPEPWIEINSVDARKYGIKDNDWVKVVTARNEDFAGDSLESVFPNAKYGEGFRARVGVGVESNQRTGVGVVAIPWHWGDRGLSTGSRANDVTIDAFDANTTIPEYKACLCRVEPIPTSGE